jgi:glycerophosphoryl diester phosphodiesterase
MPNFPLIVAHRGASAVAPENTIAAFRLAIESGAEGIEFDVRLARDGVPVVIHDSELFRTTGKSGRVLDLDSSQLAALDAVSWFSAGRHVSSSIDQARIEGVPSLAETLEVLRDYLGTIYVELKCKDGNVEPLVRAVCQTLRGSPLASQVVVKSFRLSAIPLIKMIAPELRTAALFAPRIRTILRKGRYLVAIAAELGVDELSIHKSLATRKLMKKANQHGLPVTIWTADDPRWVTRAVNLGYKAIITNDPVTLLRSRSELLES